MVNGKETEWRFNEKYDPYVSKGAGFEFYGPALKALPSGNLDTVTDNWAPIRSTVGVSKLVRFGGEPAPVPDNLIEALRARENKQGVQDVPLHSYQRGQKVRIEEGPFMGYEGIFLAKTGEERVLVLLDVVGKQAKARVDIESLGPVEN